MKNSSPWFDSVPATLKYPSFIGETTADIVVVGGGIVGIMTAWLLAKRGKNVVLLEKNTLASGETGFTTGFITRVPDTSLSTLKQRYGLIFLKKLMSASAYAQSMLKELILSRNIICDFFGCASFYCSYSNEDAILLRDWEAIRDADAHVSFFGNEDAQLISSHMHQAICFEGEGHFHIRKFLFGLLDQPEFREHVKIFENSEVLEINVAEVKTEIETETGSVFIRTGTGKIKANKLVLATGKPHDSFSELHALFHPKITYAITARYKSEIQLPNHLFWDTFDPYFYYRKIDESTLIFGGADHWQNLKMPSDPGLDPYEKLVTFAMKTFGHEHDFDVLNKWSGRLFDSEDGLPFAAEHPNYAGRVFIGSCCGFGGNGIVFGTLAAITISDLVCGLPNEFAELLDFSRTGVKIEMNAGINKIKKISNTAVRIRVASVNSADTGPYCILAESGSGVGEKKIAVFKKDGLFYAIENSCTHQGGSLCDGTLDGKIVTCPLHGAKFDITTGAVEGLPATRPVTAYKIITEQNDVFVEINPTINSAINSAVNPSTNPIVNSTVNPVVTARAIPNMFDGMRKNPGYVFKASMIALAFWFIQFLYVYFFATGLVGVAGQLQRSLILASAYTGATLIGISLIIGPLATLWPKYNFIFHRRTFGVWGFTFILMHAVVAFAFYWDDFRTNLLSNLNPFQNAVLFGIAAFFIYVPLQLTSTDWAVSKLGFKTWKRLHRLIYLAFIFSVIHFLRVNGTPLFANYSKASLVAVAVFATLFEIVAFFKYMFDERRRTVGAMIYGGFLLILGAILLYLTMRQS